MFKNIHTYILISYVYISMIYNVYIQIQKRIYTFRGAGLQHNMIIEMPSVEFGEIQHDCRLAFPVEYEVPAHVWIGSF